MPTLSSSTHSYHNKMNPEKILSCLHATKSKSSQLTTVQYVFVDARISMSEDATNGWNRRSVIHNRTQKKSKDWRYAIRIAHKSNIIETMLLLLMIILILLFFSFLSLLLRHVLLLVLNSYQFNSYQVIFDRISVFFLQKESCLWCVFVLVFFHLLGRKDFIAHGTTIGG